MTLNQDIIFARKLSQLQEHASKLFPEISISLNQHICPECKVCIGEHTIIIRRTEKNAKEVI